MSRAAINEIRNSTFITRTNWNYFKVPRHRQTTYYDITALHVASRGKTFELINRFLPVTVTD